MCRSKVSLLLDSRSRSRSTCRSRYLDLAFGFAKILRCKNETDLESIVPVLIPFSQGFHRGEDVDLYSCFGLWARSNGVSVVSFLSCRTRPPFHHCLPVSALRLAPWIDCRCLHKSNSVGSETLFPNMYGEGGRLTQQNCRVQIGLRAIDPLTAEFEPDLRVREMSACSWNQDIPVVAPTACVSSVHCDMWDRSHGNRYLCVSPCSFCCAGQDRPIISVFHLLSTSQAHSSVRIKGTENNYEPVQCLNPSCPNRNPHMHCPFCVDSENYHDPVILKAHYRVKHVDKGIDFAGKSFCELEDQLDWTETLALCSTKCDLFSFCNHSEQHDSDNCWKLANFRIEDSEMLWTLWHRGNNQGIERIQRGTLALLSVSLENELTVEGPVKHTVLCESRAFSDSRCKNGFNRRDEAIKHYRTHFRNPETTFQIQIAQVLENTCSIQPVVWAGRLQCMGIEVSWRWKCTDTVLFSGCQPG